MAQKDIKDWGVKKTQKFLVKERLGHLFKGKKVTGVDLLDLDRLKKIGIKKRGDRLRIFNTVIKNLGKKSPSKVLKDPIHGLMELHPLLITIIDTPQFQRLRCLKQLGGAYFVYPGASHNRFEHSIGVAHLAGELATALRSKQPELKINERDILCVQIAGLCHDLGHGPFSHLYDGIFLPEARYKAKAKAETESKAKAEDKTKHKSEDETKDKDWKHEDASLKMFDHLVADNGLKPLMELYGLKPEDDLVFIKEMIQGKPLNDAEDQKWPYQGRGEDKCFLYEIVANKLNGIDVDKFDYFARDAYHLGMQSNFDHKRFIMLARVCEVKHETTTRKHICSRDKEVGNLYDMFHTRYCLHRRAYQHKTNKIIETMISDAFLKADDKYFQDERSGGKKLKLSTAKDDMEAYTQLTDHVFERILYSSGQELGEARNILERIVSRNLYKFVGKAKPKQDGQANIPEGKISSLRAKLAGAENQADNFEVNVMTFDYGMKTEDPINHTYFYSKHDLRGGFKIKEDQRSKLLPDSFSEKIIWACYKNGDIKVLEQAKDDFKTWCRDNDFAVLEEEAKPPNQPVQ